MNTHLTLLNSSYTTAANFTEFGSKASDFRGPFLCHPPDNKGMDAKNNRAGDG